MMVEDRLLLLDVLLDVRVRLAPDREHLAVSGAREAVGWATPLLVKMKSEIVAHLRAAEADAASTCSIAACLRRTGTEGPGHRSRRDP